MHYLTYIFDNSMQLQRQIKLDRSKENDRIGAVAILERAVQDNLPRM